MHSRLAQATDIEGIQALQALNLYTNLTQAQRSAQGFVTTPFTPDHIQTLIDENGAFVVEKAGAIVGYAFAGSWAFFSQWPIFPHMVSLFTKQEFQNILLTELNTFQYGPVCIDQALRGTDAFPALFAFVRQEMRSRYPIGITFINQANSRSVAAHHRKLKLEIINEFEFNQNSFYTLAFPTTDRN